MSNLALEIDDWDAFFQWVATRRAHDNPRGDFIDDTRTLLKLGRSGDYCRGRVRTGGVYAMEICDQLLREYFRWRKKHGVC